MNFLHNILNMNSRRSEYRERFRRASQRAYFTFVKLEKMDNTLKEYYLLIMSIYQYNLIIAEVLTLISNTRYRSFEREELSNLIDEYSIFKTKFDIIYADYMKIIGRN